jgi:hypothetical protein
LKLIDKLKMRIAEFLATLALVSPGALAFDVPDADAVVPLSTAFLGARFGKSVGLNADTLAVGADKETNPGAVFLYEPAETATGWNQTHKITVESLTGTGGNGLYFGSDLVLGDDTLVVSAVGASKAFILGRNKGGPNNWGLVKGFVSGFYNHYGTYNEAFSRVIALDQDTLVVAAPQWRNTEGPHGAVGVYERDEGGEDNWGEVAFLQPDDAAGNQNFGVSVSVSGDAVAGTDGSQQEVYVFHRDEGGEDNWGKVTKLAQPGSGSDFGKHVVLNGDTLFVAAPSQDDAGSNSGSVFVYRRDHGGPNAYGLYKRLDGLGVGDYLGSAIAVKGDTLVAAHAFGEATTKGFTFFGRNEGGEDNWGFLAKDTPVWADDLNADNVKMAFSTDETAVVVGHAFKGGANPNTNGAVYYFETPNSCGGGDVQLLQTEISGDGGITMSFEVDEGNFLPGSLDITFDGSCNLQHTATAWVSSVAGTCTTWTMTSTLNYVREYCGFTVDNTDPTTSYVRSTVEITTSTSVEIRGDTIVNPYTRHVQLEIAMPTSVTVETSDLLIQGSAITFAALTPITFDPATETMTVSFVTSIQAPFHLVLPAILPSFLPDWNTIVDISELGSDASLRPLTCEDSATCSQYWEVQLKRPASCVEVTPLSLDGEFTFDFDTGCRAYYKGACTNSTTENAVSFTTTSDNYCPRVLTTQPLVGTLTLTNDFDQFIFGSTADLRVEVLGQAAIANLHIEKIRITEGAAAGLTDGVVYENLVANPGDFDVEPAPTIETAGIALAVNHNAEFDINANTAAATASFLWNEITSSATGDFATTTRVEVTARVRFVEAGGRRLLEAPVRLLSSPADGRKQPSATPATRASATTKVSEVGELVTAAAVNAAAVNAVGVAIGLVGLALL